FARADVRVGQGSPILCECGPGWIVRFRSSALRFPLISLFSHWILAGAIANRLKLAHAGFCKGIVSGSASLCGVRYGGLPPFSIGEFSELPRPLFQLLRMFPQSVWKTRHTRISAIGTNVVAFMPVFTQSLAFWAWQRAKKPAPFVY